MIDDPANDALDALSSCQCCLLGGQQRSLKTLYFHLGRTEIYSDMLKECFDIRLSVGSEKSGICEVCVGRLRDASNFKHQVEHSQLELRKRLKRALGILEEEPVAAIKRETDEGKTSYILLDEESAVELSDDDGASPVMFDGNIKSEDPDEDGTTDCPPEKPAAIVKSEVNEDDDGTNGNLSDDGHPIKSEKPDNDAKSDEDLSPACSLSARARRQLAMTCSVRLERLNDLEAHMCHICHITFKHESSLATHMVEHDDNQIHNDTYICNVCKQWFTLRGDLERHISRHAREKPFNCEICYKSFSCRQYLRKHVLIHTAQKPFKCELCYKSFSCRRYIKSHALTHTAQKTFNCLMCYKSFSTRSNLKRHVRIHDAQKPFKCEICNKQFNKKVSLKNHSRIHIRGKLYSCDIKQFTLKSSMGTHVETHIRRKTYSCDTCHKSFSRKRDLERHVVVHTGEKPYSCDMCNRQFTDKSSMRKHVKFTLHTFKCNVCNKQFARKKEMITHVNIHTGQMPFECEMRKELSPEEEHLNIHFTINK